jgi:hypothetical protein
MRLRAFEPDDLPAVTALWNTSWADAPRGFAISSGDFARRVLAAPTFEATTLRVAGFVSGLEYSLPVAAEAYATSFIANLNAARDSFPEAVPCPLVLLVPEYVLIAILRSAPNFFSVRSGVYCFAAKPQETASLAQSITARDEQAVISLPLAEKLERITYVQSLLQDYQSLPPAQRDLKAEARLLHRSLKAS